MRIRLNDQELSHHGVKGMKWGVRKAPGSATTKGGAAVHPDRALANKHAQTVHKHGTAALSNDDLKKLNERLNLEQQFSTLASNRKSSGQKFASDLVKRQGNQQADKLAGHAVRKGAKIGVKLGAKLLLP